MTMSSVTARDVSRLSLNFFKWVTLLGLSLALLTGCQKKSATTASPGGGGGMTNDGEIEYEVSGTIAEDEAPLDFVESIASVEIGGVNLSSSTAKFNISAFYLSPLGKKILVYQGTFNGNSFSFKSNVPKHLIVVEALRVRDGGKFAGLLPPPMRSLLAKLRITRTSSIAAKMADIIADKAASGNAVAQSALATNSISVADVLTAAQGVRRVVDEQQSKGSGSAIDLSALAIKLAEKSNERLSALVAEGQTAESVAAKISEKTYESVFGENAETTPPGVLAHRTNLDLGTSTAANKDVAYEAIKALGTDSTKIVDEAFRVEATTYREASSVTAAVAAESTVASQFSGKFDSCKANISDCATGFYTPPQTSSGGGSGGSTAGGSTPPVPALLPGPSFGLEFEAYEWSYSALNIYSTYVGDYEEYEWQQNAGSGWMSAGGSDTFQVAPQQPYGPMSVRLRVKISGVWTDWSVQSFGVKWQPRGTLQNEVCDGAAYRCCADFADGAGGSFNSCGAPNSYGTFAPVNWGISDENFRVVGEPSSSGAQLVWPVLEDDWWGGTADTRKYVLKGPNGNIDVPWTSTTYFMPLPAGTTSTVTIAAVSAGGTTLSNVTVSITTAPAMYFTAAANNQAGNLNNWFQNAAGTIPAVALPTSADDVVFLEDVDNTGGTTFYCRNLTASGVTLSNFLNENDAKGIVAAGVVTLSNVFLYDAIVDAVSIVATSNSAADGNRWGSILRASTSIILTDFVDTGVVSIESPDVQLFGTGLFYYIVGNATFNDTTLSMRVVGNATFNDSSKNVGLGQLDADDVLVGGVDGNATFNDSSENRGRVGGNATFNNNAVNAFVSLDPANEEFVGVRGNATFNDASRNCGLVEGTITSNTSNTTGVCAAAVAPTVPTSLSGTAGNGQVSLTWTSPANNGGAAITDYTVQFSSNGGSTWTTFSRAASAAERDTVTGLTNGTTYVFRVAAVNAAGTGAYTAASSGMTPVSTASAN